MQMKNKRNKLKQLIKKCNKGDKKSQIKALQFIKFIRDGKYN